MTNNEAVDRFDQSHVNQIDKLFWIATSLENSDLKYFLEEIDDKDFKKLFPQFKKKQDRVQFLIDSDMFGFIAEVSVPKCDNFHYKENGELLGWSVHDGFCRVTYVYGETPEELMQQIEKAGERIFKEFLLEEKVEKLTNAL